MPSVAVAKLSDVPPGSCLTVEARGMGLVLCNLDGSLYAVDNTCPHAGGPLGEGIFKGPYLECPWHGWRYDVRTGERPENPEITVACYPIRVIEGVVYVELPDES